MKRIISLVMCFIMAVTISVSGAEEKNALDDQAKSTVLMEAGSGTIISANNENEKLSPASITKIMTLIIIFDYLHSGKIKLTDMVTTSAHAKSMGGSQVFLEEGEEQSVETMIKCIIIASGNDASTAMAEHIAGSEEAFVKKMNQRAKELGMKNTNFMDCCGLTDDDNHYTTAKDVAIMSRELITKYPEIFKYSTIWMETIIHKTKQGEKEFVLSNTNKLLKTNSSVKGLKTGSTAKAKYCVSTVAEKNGVELIAVVMAAPDYKARFAIAEKMLNYGFSNCKVYKDEKPYRNNIKVLNGKQDKIKAEAEEFSYVDTTGTDLNKIKITREISDKIVAPIKKGEQLGSMVYTLNGKKIGESKILAKETVKKADYKYEFVRMLGLMFQIN